MAKQGISFVDNESGFTYRLETESDVLSKSYNVKLPEKDGALATTEDVDDAVANASAIFINKPTITAPVSGATNFNGTVTASAYSTSDTFTGLQTGAVWQFATDENFSNIVLESTEGNLSSITPVLGLALTTIYVRVKYVSGVNVSKWSNAINFETPNVYVATPTLTVEGTPSSVGQTPLMSTSAFSVVNGSDTHASTTWRVINAATSAVVWESVNDTTNKLSVRVPAGILQTGTEYRFIAIHNGTNYGPSAGVEVTGTTVVTFINLGEDGLNTIISGNTVDGAYFGEITAGNLITTRNYRGPYKTGTTFKANTQVSHNGQLWNALVDVTDIEPGTNASKWEVDDRENLPTGEWLLYTCGVGVGLNDANADGYSTISASIGALKNNDQGFLKFAKDNKVIYVAKKPFADTIGWNDLAKRNLVYGDRTLRIGSRLYYVRLITEAEYQDCLVASTNGTLASLATTDLALEEKTWVHDTQEGSVRKAYSGTATVENLDPKARVGSYRPVLELIEEGNEPYNNLPACPAATNENFQYDPYTDTGYFGEVPSTSILSGTELANSLGLTAGTAQHDTAGYLKFYWHGKVLFVAKRTLRHTVSWENVKSANAVFGVDLGGSGKATVSASGYNYIVALMTGATTAPADDVEYWANYSANDFLGNVALEVGRYSQWNELMYRVHQTIVDDVLANQDGLQDNQNKTLTGGVQIGANWANFTNVDLSVYYAEAGNGTVTWTQETSTNVTTYRVHRGTHRLAFLGSYTSTYAFTNFGWRPSLILN